MQFNSGQSTKGTFAIASNDHGVPHFHAIYNEYNGVFEINSLKMIEGDLPAKAKELIVEWASLYKNELLEMWNTQNMKKLPGIE